MNFVLDASAMIAFLRGEAGADGVAEALLDSDDSCCAHALNLCDVWQAAGSLKARLRRISLADCFALELSERRNAILPITTSLTSWQRSLLTESGSSGEP